MKLTAEGIAVIEGDTYLSQEIIEKKRLDVAKDFLEQFRQYIPAGGTVVDAGASLGDYTATFSEMVGPEGLVVAYEPNYPTFECLVHNMRKFQNVKIRGEALGSRYYSVDVIVDSNNIGASRLVPATGENVADEVDVNSLDDECGYFKWERLDFFKIDTEGWEPLVLDGAIVTITRFRPVMLIEVNTWPLGKMNFTAEDVFSRLDKLNYKFDRFDGPYGDILCLPKEKA